MKDDSLGLNHFEAGSATCHPDGTKSGALPLIKHDLSLSYLQVSLLSAVPLVAGSILEMPVGVISGTGARRRRFILGGGLIFITSVLAAGLAPDFANGSAADFRPRGRVSRRAWRP